MANDIDDIISSDTDGYDSNTIKYSFALADSEWDGVSSFGNSFDPVHSKGVLSAGEQSILITAMEAWAAYSNVNFVPLTAGDADLVFYQADTMWDNTTWNTGNPLPGNALQAPATTIPLDYVGTKHSKAEIVLEDNINFSDGSHYSYYVALHEIGHSLGLVHPVSGDYDPDYNVLKTVMTYNLPGQTNAFGDYWAITPMAYDIAALQKIYGSFDANTGNTSYDATWFEAYGVYGTNHIAMTIVDTGGTDTIDLSAISGSHVVDLREAINSSDVWQNAATIINDNSGISNDGEYIFIARGSVIENAIGGAGDDIIRGNSAANTLIGGAGNDIIDGGSDRDSLQYQSSAQLINVSIIESVTAPVAALSGPIETDAITGIEVIEGTAAADTISITLLPNIPLVSSSSLQEVYTGNGNDVVSITGGANPNLTVYLGAGADTVKAMVEGAVVYGDSGADTFYLGKNYLIADASSEDRIMMNDVLTLTGGIRWATSESEWAVGVGGIKYGVNTGNELIIRDMFGNDTFVANFNNSIEGPYTAGILVGTLTLEFYRLMNLPSGFNYYDTFEVLLGYAMKAMTGRSLFEGIDPLVLDLDGDGIELSGRTVYSPYFDIDGDGFSEQTGWVRSDDGFLTLDVNENGTIDDVSEMFGNMVDDGFSVLSDLDSNNDGVIDENDDLFEDLRIWKDSNGNAITDAGELLTLAEADIVSISLDTTPSTDTISGHDVTDTASFTRTDNSTGTIANIEFMANHRDTIWLGDSTIDVEAAALPELTGFGTLTSLRIAMTDSEDLKTAVETIVPTLDTVDLTALRALITPILTEWADAVDVPVGTPGLVTRQDVPILTETTLEGGTEVYDYAYQVTDGMGTYWKLASGNDVLDVNDDPILRPTYNDIMSQVPTEGSWIVFKGADIQFMERYIGTSLPIGEDNLTGSESIAGAKTLITYMWSDLNKIAVRLAMQGPLSEYFEGVQYNAETNKFEPTTEHQITPMLEAIFNDAPSTALDTEAYLAEWKPMLGVFLQDLDRGEAYLNVTYAYVFQYLVAAYENVGLATSIVNAAGALDIPTDLIRTGTGIVNGGTDADIFYLGAGNQTVQGGLGPDTYVVGANFGQDVINDVEEPLQAKPDMLRFAHLNADDITMERDGVDLIISVTGSPDELTIIGQFEGARTAPGIGTIDPDYGIKEIVFANGQVWDLLDIAKAVERHTSGNDIIVGTDTIDFLDGGAGNDILQGAGEGDVYRFGLGDGEDIINENMGYIFVDVPDILQFKAGLTYEDVIFTRDGDDLIITIDGSSDQLTITDQFLSAYTGPYGQQWLQRIESFAFESGGFISWREVIRELVADGKTSGNDTIYGFDTDDRLDGGAGNDYLSGGNENDIYIWGHGYGNDTIEELRDNILSGGIDTVKFNTGVTTSNITLTRVEDSDDLTLSLSDGSTLEIINQFQMIDTVIFGLQEFNHIEEFLFSDNTIWTKEDVMQMLIDQSITAGNDAVYGFYREDTLEGGTGDDYLAGGEEGDIYVYAEGDGNDTIYDYSTHFPYGENEGADKLSFIDINPEDITVERTGYDIVLRITATNETITLKDQGFSYPAGSYTEIEQIQFADTTIWSKLDLREEYILQAKTSGADHIVGFSGADIIAGGAGNDLLEGWGGADTYQFNIGDGQDIINDFANYIGWDQPDTVQFGAGITVNDLLLSRVGDDLVIGIDGTTDTLTIQDHFYGALTIDWYAIENFVFADSSSLNQQEIAALLTLTSGTNGNDTIIGSAYADTLNGKQGNDMLQGKEGNDTYYYELGDGTDTIREVYDYYKVETDTLVFGAGITSDMIQFQRSVDTNDVTLTFQGNSGSILIEDQFYNFGSYGVERVIFGNNAEWNRVDMQNAYLDYVSTTGNDTILGFATTSDTLQGGLGNDTLNGMAGSDTYIYEIGDGSDSIQEINDFYGVDTDKLILGTGLNPNDLVLTRTESTAADITLSFSSTSGSIVLKNQFFASGYNGIEQIVFGDSTTWNITDMKLAYLARAKTSGNNTIVGFTASNDTLEGGLGNDTLNGLEGNDTYIFNLGDGSDTIKEAYDFYKAENDTLQLGAGLNADIIWVQQTGNDVTLKFSNLTDSIMLDEQANTAGGYQGVEQIIFADSTVWDRDDFLFGTTAANTLNGNSSNNVIFAHAGNDTINGGDGDDRIDGGSGADTINGGNGTDTVSYAASTAAVTVTLANTTAQTSTGDASGDIISNVENLIGSIYADTLTGNSANNRLVGGNGNDTLIGGQGVDTMLGGLGADTFKFSGSTDSGTGSGNRDILVDFSSANSDLIDLSEFASTFTFLGTGAFTGTANEVNYSQSGGNTIIGIDTNGDSVLDLELELAGLHSLSSTDFVL